MNYLRPILVCAALAGGFLTLSASANPPAKPKPNAQQERQKADDLRRYDKNKNGKLDPDERKQMQKDRSASRQFMNAP